MFTFTNSWLLSWTKQGKFKGRSLEQLVGLWQLWCGLPRPTEQTSGLSLGFWAECPGLSGLFCCLQLQAMPCKDDGIMLQRIVWCGISVPRWGSKDLLSSLWRPRKTGHDVCASPGCITSGWVYFCWYRTFSHSLVSSLLCFCEMRCLLITENSREVEAENEKMNPGLLQTNASTLPGSCRLGCELQTKAYQVQQLLAAICCSHCC